MDSIVPLIVALIILVILSAYFSATETAFSTFNNVRMKTMANNGNKRAQNVIDLYNNFEKLITNILIGNNIVNLTSASLATILFALIISNTDLSVTISTIVITIVVLIFGEIFPKTFAKNHPESFAMFSAPIIIFIGYIIWPISIIFRGLQKITGKKTNNTENLPTVTNDELITIIEEAEEGGELDSQDSSIIKKAIEFNDVTVYEILVPRVDIKAVERSSTMEEIKNAFQEFGFSRLPVYKENLDHIVGFIHSKDFYDAYTGNAKGIDNIIKPVLETSSETSVGDLLMLLRKNKQHIAVVIDEFGGTDGIVTMEDCLEQLVGEIFDEHDEVVEMISKVSEKEYLINGDAELDNVFEVLNIKNSDEFESISFGGWLLEQLNKAPELGTKYTYKGVEFKVIKTDFKRVVLVKAIIS